MTSNKRQHPRVKAAGVASHFRAGDELALGLLVENISLGGLFVRTDEPLPVGTPLVLELVRTGLKSAIKVSGRVVTSLQTADALPRGLTPGMGVRFDPLTPDALARVEELVGAIGPPPDSSAINPTQVDRSRRSAFDFGFVSLESIPEEAPAPRPAPAPIASPARTPVGAAAQPAPVTSTDRSDPAAAPPATSPPVMVVGGARLMVQIRGLLFELAEANAELSRLREENTRLREEAEQKDRRIAELAPSRKGAPSSS